ncbi:hypothetical protein D3C80_1556860 [compost metagenome]
MSGHEAFAQGLGHRGQRAFLGQQQGDFADGLAGQLLELGQGQRQLNGGRVFRVLGTPLLDGSLLQFQRARGFHRHGQAHPATEFVVGDRLQLIGWQGRDKSPDGLMVLAGGVTFEHRCNGDALADCGQGLAIGFEGAGADGAGAHLLLVGQLVQALQAWMAQGG